MARRLATAVVLTSTLGGTVTYRAGSTPPPEAAEKITNPDAWLPEDAEEDTDPGMSPVVVRPDPPAKPSAELGGGAEGTPPTGGGTGEEPARNASTAEWKAYAEGLGQTVPEDAGREAIVAQLVSAGLIKE